MQEAKNRFIIVFIFILSLALGCTHKQTVSPKYGTAYDQMQDAIQEGITGDKALRKRHTHSVPSSVSNALLPPFNSYTVSRTRNTAHRFNIAANKVPAKEFFMGLVEGTPYNMVVNPSIDGTISLNLKNVTIGETLKIVRDVYGYRYRNKGFSYEIYPQEMETQIFNVNYLDIQRKGKSVTSLSTGQISEKVTGTSTGSTNNFPQPSSSTSTEQPSGSEVDTRSEMNFWKGLENTLKTMIGTTNGRSVVANPQAGIVIIHALPPELHQVARYLDRIQSRMNRQVILEAKILEVQLNDQFQAGINWNMFGAGFDPNTQTNEIGMSQIGSNTFEGTELQDFTSIFTLNAGKGQFNILIKMLQTQGNVQVLSSPRISTVNNQKAVIKVGQDQFFVTGVSTENTVTANSTIPTQDVSLTPFFSGITFDVTPQISGDDTVILHIHPSVSLVTEQQKNIVLGQTVAGQNNTLTLPLALSTIRESDNVVRAKNGQIIVIGGLMQNSMIEEIAGTPGLSNIPFIGALFRRTQQVARKTELIILLRPIIVERKTWVHELEDDRETMKQFKRGFHYGGLTQVFGDEGERDDT